MTDYPAKADKRQINLSVPAKVHTRCVAEAAKRGVPVSTYATTLFMAAYSASCQETGDRTLDATVAATLILSSAGLDAEDIARALKCSVNTAVNIIDAFRKEAA